MSDKKTVLFLGSGASIALAGIATQDNFSKDVLQNERKKWIERSGVSDIRETKFSDWIIETGNIELIMSYLHNVAYRTPEKMKEHKELSYKAANINFRAAIVEYLKEKSKLIYKSKERKETWNRFCTKIKKLSEQQLVVLTTNYDLLMEKAIKKAGKDYFYPAISLDNTANNNKIPIYKLLGSINWMEKRFFEKLRNNKWDIIGYSRPKIFLDVTKKSSRKKDKRRYYIFKKEKNIYTPIFIPFFFQKEQWFSERWESVFKPHWKHCEKCLKDKIKEIYFIGYSLRPEDHPIMHLLMKIFGNTHPKIEIYCKVKGENLEKVLSPFDPKVSTCGLEAFLDRHL